MSYEYIRKTYGIEFKVGQRIQSLDGKYRGTVVSNTNRQEHYAYVRIDGRNHSDPFHPLDLKPEVA